MNFNYLSTTQIVTLALAVVFSILAVATTFFAFKNAERLKSKTIVFVLTMVMPFVAITCWLILIFSFVEGFKNNDIVNIFVSIAIALITCFMILIVANALYQKHKKDLEQRAVMEEEAKKLAEEAPTAWSFQAVEAPEEVEEVIDVQEEEQITEQTAIEEVEEEKVEEVAQEPKTEEEKANFWTDDAE